jgi:hypothetical protein
LGIDRIDMERGGREKREMIGCLDRQHKTHIGGTFLGERIDNRNGRGLYRVLFEKKRKKERMDL